MTSTRPGTIYIASDHAGFALKQTLSAYLSGRGWAVADLGADSEERCDYPLFADKLCAEVLQTGGIGILVCGSGIGVSIAANRHRGIRAALCTHEMHARACRAHNDANVLCLGQNVTAPNLALRLVDLFLETDFEGGRHQTRLSMIDRPEE